MVISLNGKVGTAIKIKLVNKTKTLCQLFINQEHILEYQDVKIDENTFIRYINRNKYFFSFSKLELMETDKITKFITPLNKPKKNITNFLTLDIETYLDSNNYQIPYCICIYDGSSDKSYKYYLDEFKNSEDMLIASIKDICKSKYNDYTVYAHNFSSFDGLFLLKILNKIGIITPLIKDGKLISVNLSYQVKENSDKFYNLKFNDSLLLLQASLKKLGKSFKVETLKGDFDTTSVNESNLKLLKKQVLDYCCKDCISLYQILIKFNNLIYNKFNVNIKSYPTLPSLSFGNYRTNYLNEKMEIAQISGKMYENIRNSYTGGSTDMFIPFNNENELIYCYDVNSLYPFVMKEFEYPVGSHTYFEGNIRKFDEQAFGVFFCEIKSPEYLEHPIIQTHVKTKNGIRTVSPLGE
jgi:hypothetical protein